MNIENSKDNSLCSTIDPFKVAGGMLRNDRRVVIPLFVALSISSFLVSLIPETSPIQLGALLGVDRLLQLFVIATITLRWTKRFQLNFRSFNSHVLAFSRVIIFGFGIWALTTPPFFLALYVKSEGLRIVLMTSLCAGLFFCFRYYFFFGTALLFGGTLRSSARAAFVFSMREPRAAFRSLVGPIGLTALLTSCLLIPFPDGRSVILNSLASAAEGVFWILSTYTALGFMVVQTDDSEWRRAGLVPYRTDRLKTLQAQSRPVVGRLLTPSSGAKALVIALVVMLGNLARDMSMPPAAEVTIKRSLVDDYKIRMEIVVSDSTYKLRGFKPSAFSIKSKTGFPLSDALTKSALSELAEEKLLTLPSSSEPTPVFLEFRTPKTKENIITLDNAWLWYQMVPIAPLPLKHSH